MAVQAAGAHLTSAESMMFELLRSKDHPQFKPILTRKCVDVSKVNFTLRYTGDRVQPDQTATFDMRAAIESVLEEARLLWQCRGQVSLLLRLPAVAARCAAPGMVLSADGER